ncbi:MAG: GGDEF domain-containing protein, partial [Pygmaiobacter sp.]
MKQIACQKQVLNQDECINALKIVLADPGLRKKTAVYALELEDFKQFNSTFGYAYGDLLIAEIQHYLAGFDGVEVFRVSGVGFVLIKRATNYTQADEVAAEIAQRFNDIWHIREMDCVCAMNLGALYPT